MSIRNIDDQKNELLKKIESITTSDTISQFMEKCNNNFSEIAKYGGGPVGEKGDKGSQGNPTKPKVPIHVWKKGENGNGHYGDEIEIEITSNGSKTKTYEIIDINDDELYQSKYQEGHLIMLENAHAYVLKNYDQQLKPEFVAAISSLNTKDLEEALTGIYGYVHIAYAKNISEDKSGWEGFITDQQITKLGTTKVSIEGNENVTEEDGKLDKGDYNIFYLGDYKYMGIYSDNYKISVSNPEKYTWFNIQKDNYEATLSKPVTTVLVDYKNKCINETETLTTHVYFYKNSETISVSHFKVEIDEKYKTNFEIDEDENKVSCKGVKNIDFTNGDFKLPIQITYENHLDESIIVTKTHWTLSPIKALEDVKIFIDKNVVNISNTTVHNFKIGYHIFTNGKDEFVESNKSNNESKKYKWYFINSSEGLNKIITNIQTYRPLKDDSDWNEIVNDFAKKNHNDEIIGKYKYCYVILCDENYKLIDCDVITAIDNGNDISLGLLKPYIALPANIEGTGVHKLYKNPITSQIVLYDNGTPITSGITYEFYNEDNKPIVGTINDVPNISVDKDGVITIDNEYLERDIKFGHKEIKCKVKYKYTDENGISSEYDLSLEKILTIELKETPYKLEFDRNTLKRDKDKDYKIIGETLKCNVKCYINGSWENDNTHSVKVTLTDEYSTDYESNIENKDYGYTLSLSKLNEGIYKDINNITISYCNGENTYLTETICILDDGDKGNDIYLELSKPYIVLPANLEGKGVHDEYKEPITSKIALYDNGTPITSGVDYKFYNEDDVLIEGNISVDGGVITIDKDYLTSGIENGHKEIKCKAIYNYTDDDTSDDVEVTFEKILTIDLKETPYKLEFNRNTLKRKNGSLAESELKCNVKCYINGLWVKDNSYNIIPSLVDVIKIENGDSDYNYTLNLSELNSDEYKNINNFEISCNKDGNTYLTETIWILDDGDQGIQGETGPKGDDIYLDLSIPYIILPANLEGNGVHELYDDKKNPITSKIILYKNGDSIDESSVTYKFYEYNTEKSDWETEPIKSGVSVKDGVITITKDYLKTGITNGHKEIKCETIYNYTDDNTYEEKEVTFEKILTIGLDETRHQLELSAVYGSNEYRGNIIKYSEKLSKLKCDIKTYINGEWKTISKDNYKIRFFLKDSENESQEFEFNYVRGTYSIETSKDDLLTLLKNADKFNLDLISSENSEDPLLTEDICLVYDADYTCLELSKKNITLPANIDGTGVHELYINDDENTYIPLLTFKIYDSINYDLAKNYIIKCFYKGKDVTDNFLISFEEEKNDIDYDVKITKNNLNKLFNGKVDIFEIKIVAKLKDDTTKEYESYFYIEMKETPYKLEVDQKALKRGHNYIVSQSPLRCNIKCYINGAWEKDNSKLRSVKATYETGNKTVNIERINDDSDYDYAFDLEDLNENINNIVISYSGAKNTYLTEKIWILEPGLKGEQGIPGPNMYLDLSKSHFILPANIDGNGVHDAYNEDITSKVTLYKDGTSIVDIDSINSIKSSYKFHDENGEITQYIDENGETKQYINVNDGVITITKDYLKRGITNGHKEIKCIAEYTYKEYTHKNDGTISEESKKANFEKILTFELKETPYKLEFDKNTLKRDKYKENKVIGDTLKCNVICYIDGTWVNDNSTFSVKATWTDNNNTNYSSTFDSNIDSDSDSDYDYGYTLYLSELSGVDNNIVISCYAGEKTYLTETIWVLDDGVKGHNIYLDLSKSHFILPANIDGTGIHELYDDENNPKPITSKITLYDNGTSITYNISSYKFYDENGNEITQYIDENGETKQYINVNDGVITIDKEYLKTGITNGHKEIKFVATYKYKDGDTNEEKEVTFEKILTIELKETPYKLEFDKNILKRDKNNKYEIVDGTLNCNIKCYINGTWKKLEKDNTNVTLIHHNGYILPDKNIEPNYTYTFNLTSLNGVVNKNINNIVISYYEGSKEYLTETIWILDDGADGADGYSISLELSKPHIVLPANIDGTGVHYAYDEAITSKITLYDNGKPITNDNNNIIVYDFVIEDYNLNFGDISIDNDGVITIKKACVTSSHTEIICKVQYIRITTDINGVTNNETFNFEKILTIELKETPFKLELDKPILKRGKNGLSDVYLNCKIKYYMDGKWKEYTLENYSFEIITNTSITYTPQVVNNTYIIYFQSIPNNIDNIEIKYSENNKTLLTEKILILDDGKDGYSTSLDLSKSHFVLPANIDGTGVHKEHNEDITTKIALYDNGKNIFEDIYDSDSDPGFNNIISYKFYNESGDFIYPIKVENGVITIPNNYIKNISIPNGHKEIKCKVTYNRINYNQEVEILSFEKILTIELKETPFKLKLDKTTVKPGLDNENLNCQVEYFMNGQWNKYFDENDTEAFKLYLDGKIHVSPETSYNIGVFTVPFNIIKNDIKSITIKYFKNGDVNESPLLEETIFTVKDGQNGTSDNIYLELSKPYIELPSDIFGESILPDYDDTKNPISSKITLYDNGTPITDGVKYEFYDENVDEIDDGSINVTDGVIFISKNYLTSIHKEIKCVACYNTPEDKEVIFEKILTIELKKPPFEIYITDYNGREFGNVIKRKNGEFIPLSINAYIKYYIDGEWYELKEKLENYKCYIDDIGMNLHGGNHYYQTLNITTVTNYNKTSQITLKYSYKNDVLLSKTIPIIDVYGSDAKRIYRYQFNVKIDGDLYNTYITNTPEKIYITYCGDKIINFFDNDNTYMSYDKEYIGYINSEFIDINNLDYINGNNDNSFGYNQTLNTYKGKFKIVENTNTNINCDYIIYFRVTPEFKISISGINGYYNNNIKIYYDGIEYKNGDIIKTFDLDCHNINYLYNYSPSDSELDSINDYYNIECDNIISTQYGLFKCEKNIIAGNTNFTIELTYKKAYMLNIIKDSDILISDKNLCFIIDNKEYIYNDIIIIDKNRDDINTIMSNAQIKYYDWYGNLESLSYDYIFYIENSTINVEIKNTKNNYKTFKFNSITGVQENNINLYVYGHSLKLNDSIKLFCDGGYIPICNLTATHKNNRIYHFIYNYDITTDIVNIDLVYNKITELPIFETNIDDFFGTYDILFSNSDKCKCDIYINRGDSDSDSNYYYDNTFNVKFYDYVYNIFPNTPIDTDNYDIIEFTYDGEYITSQNGNDTNYMILSNYELCKINTIYENENGFKDNTITLNNTKYTINTIIKQMEMNKEEVEDDLNNSTGPTNIPVPKPFPIA